MPFISNPVAQEYVAMSPIFTADTTTKSGLVADNVGHVVSSHVGVEPLHVPSAWHVLVLDPDIEYPVTQEYVATLEYVRDGALTDRGLAAVSKGQLTIEHIGAVPLHVPSAWHDLVLDPDIEYPVTQEYVATLEYVREGALTDNGEAAVSKGQLTMEQVGAVSLHVPSAWHVLVLDPNIEYPVSQAYAASLL